jgi:hypothetical protein
MYIKQMSWSFSPISFVLFWKIILPKFVYNKIISYLCTRIFYQPIDVYEEKNYNGGNGCHDGGYRYSWWTDDQH